MASTRPGIYFGGDAAFGPKNIIWAVAHGHDAAISIDLHCRGEALTNRPPPHVNLLSQKMGIHEWSYDNGIHGDRRYRVPLKDTVIALKDIRTEVELGFDPKLAYAEAQRCLNCDVQTVFADKLCIECDACVDICPMDCITFTDERRRIRPAHAADGAGAERRPGAVRLGAGEDRAASWPRTRTCACTAGCAPSAARPARGTCRNSCSTWRRRTIARTRRRRSGRAAGATCSHARCTRRAGSRRGGPRD